MKSVSSAKESYSFIVDKTLNIRHMRTIINLEQKSKILTKICVFRHGPFDILGGGGLGYFGKKFPCSDFD